MSAAADETVNIAAAVSAMALSQPQTPAVVVMGKERGGGSTDAVWTFEKLNCETDAYAHVLEKLGVVRGMRTVLMAPPGLEFFSLTFALFKIGAIPVIIDPGMGLRNLGRCLAEAAPEAFLGVGRAMFARRLFGWGRASLRIVATIGRPWAGGRSFKKLRGEVSAAARPLVQTTASDSAAILFTSGSTGAAKGVVYTHGNFAAQVASLRALYSIEPGEIDLPTFPLFALFAPALGMTSVIPRMNFTRPGSVHPPNIFRAVEKYRCTNMFGSPALLDRVGRFGRTHGLQMPSLRRVISAGAPVPATILERISGLLRPDAEIFTPYGATEALPVCSIGSKEILGETRRATDQGAGVCVGRPAPRLKVWTIKITDQPIERWDDDLRLPIGQIGEVVVAGPVVTAEYFRRPEASRLAKVKDPDSGATLHRMGDVGWFDERGRLWFCGRKSHRVEFNGTTLFTDQCEPIFNTHPSVRRTALVGVQKPPGVLPVLCVELDAIDGRRVDENAVRRELLAIGARYTHTVPIKTILFHPRFPVDIRHNAKIFREKLAVWAARRI